VNYFTFMYRVSVFTYFTSLYSFWEILFSFVFSKPVTCCSLRSSWLISTLGPQEWVFDFGGS
jgi:hypothetical protein